MKKLIIILFLFLSVLGFSQQNINIGKGKLSGILYNTQSGAIDTIISLHPDSLGQFKFMNASDPVNDLDVINLRYFNSHSNSWDSIVNNDIGYAIIWDNGAKIDSFECVSLQQMMDTIATLPGGHDPVSLNASATNGGLSILDQEISFTSSSETENGFLSSYYFSLFNNKAPGSGSANYIWNQNDSAQTANLWINGYGTFGNDLKTNEQLYANRYFYLTNANNDPATYHPIIEVRNSRGTVGAETYLQSGDEIGAIVFRGNVVGATGGSGMNSLATEDWYADSLGSKLTFFTTPNNSTTKATRFVIEENGRGYFGGNLGVGSFTRADYPLTITSDANGLAHLTSTNNLRLWSQLSSGSARFYLQNSSSVNSLINSNGSSYLMGGNVGINNNTPAYKLDVTGDVYTSERILSKGDMWVGFRNETASQNTTFHINTYDATPVIEFDRDSVAQSYIYDNAPDSSLYLRSARGDIKIYTGADFYVTGGFAKATKGIFTNLGNYKMPVHQDDTNGFIDAPVSVSGNDISVTGTVTWSGGSSTNANTAYGWGNHSGLYWLKADTTSTLETKAYNNSKLALKQSISNMQNSTSTSTTKYPTWYAAKAYADSIKSTIIAGGGGVNSYKLLLGSVTSRNIDVTLADYTPLDKDILKILGEDDIAEGDTITISVNGGTAFDLHEKTSYDKEYIIEVMYLDSSWYLMGEFAEEVKVKGVIDATNTVFGSTGITLTGVNFESIPDSGLVPKALVMQLIAADNDSVQSLSGTTPTLNAVNGKNATITLTGNTTMTLSNLTTGKSGNVSIDCGATGRTIQFSGYTFDIAPVLEDTAGAISIASNSHNVISWYYDGTVVKINGTKNYNRY